MSDRDAVRADEELRELIGDDETLADTAAEVRAALREAEIDPAFQRRLRGQVVQERQRLIDTRGARRWPWLPRPPAAIAGLALVITVAVALVLTLVVSRVSQTRPVAVVASSAVAGLESVDPAEPVVVNFDRPMDHEAVAAALRIAPATAVRTAWSGNDLVITPLHGLAGNSPYVLTIDRALARTATGARLAADLHVVFGTGGSAIPAGPAPVPTGLPLRFVAAAGEGSEAVIAGGGLVIATSATSSGLSGLLRLHPDGAAEQLGPAADAICVSRSGRSLAYLIRGPGGTSIVMAAGDGSGGRAVRADVDAGSPNGWINDAEVTFVGGGQLKAVDRAGHVRVLTADRVDAAKDAVVFAPGGRYVYIRPAAAASTPGQGQLLDLVARSRHALQGIVGQPSFSADGGTVVWIDGSGPAPRLARAPSAGGPVLTTAAPLPVADGDQVSDLGVSPDSSRVVYSVLHPGGDGELRLAERDSGYTLAVSYSGRGESPNWAPAGNEVAVLTHAGGQPQIALASTPAAPIEMVAGAATAFTHAQIGGDREALRALASPDVDVDALPRVSRGLLVQVRPSAGGVTPCVLRLVINPTPDHPVPRAIVETVDLRTDPQVQRPVVSRASGSAPANEPPGPHLVGIRAGQDSISVTFDSDLDEASVAGPFSVSVAGRGQLPVTATLDVATRTVTLTSPSRLPAQVTLTVSTALRDIAGHHLAAPVQAPVALA